MLGNKCAKLPFCFAIRREVRRPPKNRNPAKAGCPGQRVSSFALVEAYLERAFGVRILRAFEHEQGASYAANLSQRGIKAVLARIARQLADN